MMADRTSKSIEQPRVFISYARSDGEAFATSLRARLEAENIPLWQDRVGMEGGRDWWLQITDALDHAEFMVLVMTPAALKSPVVRKEWRYARQQGVCVYPIKAHSSIDFKSLPRWMRDAHWYDLDHEWPKFLNDLNRTCEQPRVPFMVEELTADFVPRPKEFDELLSKLLDEKCEEPIAITAALRGAGGYGKTTIARAICHDERIQEAFDDGILWVTLGENPGLDRLIGLVADLIDILTHERPTFTGLDAATARLSELLSERDILLVIDDVWNFANLKPFLQGGKRCARLLTTRNERVVPPSASRIVVDAMQQSEAIGLLLADIDNTTFCVEIDVFCKLVQRLGEWPLLLKLVNSVLRFRIETHQSLSDALTFVDEALDEGGLTVFDERDSQDRNRAVAATLEVSFKLLNAEEKKRYYDLVVFPEDIDIPLEALQKLWLLGNIKTEMLCEHLFKLSLLLNFDPVNRTIRLHDVVRTYLRQEVGTQLASYDRKLLDSYCLERWADLPLNEPYMWDYLAVHLVSAGRIEELLSTLKDGHYLAAKTFARPIHALEADLLLGQKEAPADQDLSLLARTIARISHILVLCKTFHEAICVLHSRLSLLQEFTSICETLEWKLPCPFLTSWHALPDLSQSALIRTLVGHKGGVNGCAVSPSGDWIVSASDDKTLKVWDAQTGEGRLTLRGHEGNVKGCAVSPSGDWIVSASNDKTLKVWDAQTGEERLTLRGHGDMVRECAVGPSGEWVVSASDDGTLKIWDVNTGEERLTLEGHSYEVNGCAVSPTGEWIVSASNDKTLKIWDAQTGREWLTLKGHLNRVRECAVSPSGDWIVSASEDETLKIWDVYTGEERSTLKGHEDWVLGCAVSPTGEWIVSASNDKTLKVWDAQTGNCLTTLRVDDYLNACAFSPDGEHIVASGNRGVYFLRIVL